MSLQRHKWREEHWFIVEGAAKLDIEDFSFNCYSGHKSTIYQGEWHRVENIGYTPLVIVEIQLGTCIEEDIERKEDDYGRHK